MRWWRDLRLRWKIMTSYACVLVIVVAVNAFAYHATVAGQGAGQWVQHTYRVISMANDALTVLTDMQAGYRAFLATGREELLDPYSSGRQAYPAKLAALEQETADNPPQAARWQALLGQAATWQRDVTEPGIAARRAAAGGDGQGGGLAPAVELDKSQVDAMRAGFAEAMSVEQTLLEQRSRSESVAGSQLLAVLLWGTLGAAILSVLVALLMERNITGPVTQVAVAARRLAQGELNLAVPVHSTDEFGQMALAFRAMIAYQGGMADAADAIARGDLLQDVQPQSSEDVLGKSFQRMIANLRTMVAEIKHGAGRLSAVAIDQAAAIAETTATVEQVKASAEQAVQLALVVADTAQEALRVAGDGVQAAQHATAGMAELHTRVQAIADNILALSDQGQQIGDIVATVNDLADQSNLLALNAAIEASRAGEHGRGFAVVAGEIRSLAEQSKAHTAQVRTLLGDIQRATNAAVLATEQGTRGVVTGTRLVEQTEQTIAELTVVIEQAAGSAQRIAGSVRQHSVGMDQIAGAMDHINGAGASHVAASGVATHMTETLTELSRRLNDLVAPYQV